MKTHIRQCDDCGGVMTSVWSDGKTRIHKLDCRRCDATTEEHQSKLGYIECRHGDPEGDLDWHQDYGSFRERFREYRRKATNTAFSAGSPWPAVQVYRSGDAYIVAVYEDKDDTVRGHPEVSWGSETVMVNDSEFHLPSEAGSYEGPIFAVARVQIIEPSGTIRIRT